MSNIRYNPVLRVLFLVLAFSFAVQSNAMLNRKPLFLKQRFANPVQTIVDQINAPVSDSETFNTAIQQIINDRIAQYKSQDPKTWPLYLRQNPNAQAKDLADYYLLDEKTENYKDDLSYIAEQEIENCLRPDLQQKITEIQKNIFHDHKDLLHIARIVSLVNTISPYIIKGHNPQFVIPKRHRFATLFEKYPFENIQGFVNYAFTRIEQEANINTLNTMGARMTTEEDDLAFRTFLSSQGSMLTSAMPDFLDRYAEDEHGNPYLKETIPEPFFTKKNSSFLNNAEACISTIQRATNPKIYKNVLESVRKWRTSKSYPSLTTLVDVLHKYHPSVLDEKVFWFWIAD